MVAIFTGLGAGFERGSASVLGGSGIFGNAAQGRGGEGVSVNATTGNLVITKQDEFLVGRGPDVGISRTYNGLGSVPDENGDRWRFNYDRRVYGLTGTEGVVGSTVKRLSGDGAEIIYTWDAGAAAYVTKDGGGAYDRLVKSGAEWVWTDGDSRVTERYAAYGTTNGTPSFRLVSQGDADGNTLTFTYSADKLARITTADGGYVDYVWSGNNVTQLTTGYTDLVTNIAKTLARTRYAYDASNRLASVTTDLSPEDSSIADGKTYVTSYTYDAAGRVASIAQSDGSLIAVTYDASGRVTSLAQTASAGVTRTTSLAYGTGQAAITDAFGTVTTLTYDAAGQLTRTVTGSGAQNLLLRSEEADSWPWSTGGTVVANDPGRIGPDGTTTTEKVTLAAGVSIQQFLSVANTGGASGGNYVADIYVYSETTQSVAWGVYDIVLGLSYTTTTLAAGQWTKLTQAGAFGGNSTDRRVQLWLSNAGTVWVTKAHLRRGDAADTYVKTTDTAVVGGAGAGPSVDFAYNAGGDLLSVTDASGNASTFGNYDSNGNAQTVTDRLGNVTTRTYGTNNELLTETHIGSDASGAAVSHTTRYAYDSENHLRYMVTPEGYVSEYRYTPEGQLNITVSYPEHSYAIGAGAISESGLNAWRDALTDRSSIKVAQNLYDARGNVTASYSYGSAQTNGVQTTNEGVSSTHYIYGQNGQLLSRLANGQVAETYIYDGMGRLAARTDVNGGTTSFVFNDAATTTIVTLASGYVTTSTYNKAGDLVSQSDSGSYVSGGATSYLYDALGRARVATDATGHKSYTLYDKFGRMVAAINHLGDIIEYRYDANGRQVGSARYINRVTAAQLVTLGDPANSLDITALRPAAHASDLWTWSVYDKEGRVIEAIDGDGGVTTYAYDGSGRLILTMAYANKLTVTQISVLKTTPQTVPILPTADSAKDAVARTFYDRDGRVIGALDGEGYLSRILYDKAGQKVEETSFVNATSAGLRVSGSFDALLASIAVSSERRVSHYVYDGQGLLRYAVNALGQVASYSYDNAGLQVSQARYAAAIAATSDFTYDAIKALVAPLVTNTANRTSYAVYDSAGRLAYGIDAAGGVVGYTYDIMGQVTRTVAYAAANPVSAHPTKASMDSWAASAIGNVANRISRTWYSARGEARFTVDAEGYVSRADLDAAGRTIAARQWDNKVSVNDTTSIAQIDGLAALSGGATILQSSYDNAGRLASTIDGEGVITSYIYNAIGQLTGTDVASATSDLVVTAMAYDAAGRVASATRGYGTSEQATTSYSYDGLGNRTSITDPRGKVSAYSYDHLGQVKTATDALGGVTSFDYNAFGEAWKVTDARGNASYSWYDQLGRATHVRDAENYLTQSSYTIFGEAASVTRRFNTASGTAVMATPPSVAANLAQDAMTSFEYDKLGRVTKSTDALGYFETYGYDVFGNRVSVSAKSSTTTMAVGATTTYTFDRRGQMLTQTLPIETRDAVGTQTSTVIVNRFNYDARGNRITMIEADNLGYKRTTTYAYDKNSRLTATSGDAVSVIADDMVTATTITPTETLKYDRRSNVIESIDAGGARTLFYYDDLDRVIAEVRQTSVSASTYSAFTYDAIGNRLSARVYANAITLPTSAGGTAPTPPSGAYRETSFAYDGLNRLLNATISGVMVGTYASGYAVTNLVTSYQYDANGNVVKIIDANGNESWNWYDKLGRKTVSRDGEGYLTTWAYDPDGNVTSETRFATKFAGSLALAAPPSVTPASTDRTTNFSYDRGGNRLSETRLGVEAYSVNATTGALSLSGTSATITYAYNGLGQVVSKSEASGDGVTYVYDGGGRLVTESRASFIDASGVNVTPTTTYHYDGLGSLSRTLQAGAANAPTRTTTYSYGAGGRLSSMTDASGFTRNYAYDVMGRVRRESYVRITSGGASVTDAVGSTYDLAGRVIGQSAGTWNGASFTTLDYSQTQYNNYGDVWKTGQHGLWQVENQYDAAGRLIKSNAPGGVWSHFGYDAGGNQTIAITSAGQDLAGLDFAGALGLVAQADVNATYSVYDARSMAIQSVEEGRQLSSSTAATLTAARAYNAFGEVVAETNAAGATSELAYNAMGRMIRVIAPTVSITNEDGSSQWVRPVQDLYYDLSGRLVGTRDAAGSYASGGTAAAGTVKTAGSGNLNTRSLLAGTGYGGAEALVVGEYHPDGGKVTTAYDIHGDARSLVDALGRSTAQSFDAMGRLTSATKANGLTESYAYDGLGQRLSAWNSVYGAGQAARSDYDAMGRVTLSVAAGGDTTTTSYVWDGAITASGTGTSFGGWTTSITMANARTSQESADIYGRATSKSDLGGHVTTFAYDVAGRQISNSSGGITAAFTYYNSGQLATNSGPFGLATYGYDALGQKISDSLVNGGVTVKSQSLTYDALGRMVSWAEAGTTISPAASIAYEYDANNNIRRENASYSFLDAYGAASAMGPRDYWFRFDAMNRLVVDKGVLSGTVGTTIVRGSTGSDILYDIAGQRTQATTTRWMQATIWNPFAGFDTYGEPYGEWQQTSYHGNSKEAYGYDSAGQLTTTSEAVGGAHYDELTYELVVEAAVGPGTLRGSFTYDALGRVTLQQDYGGVLGVSGATYTRSATYDAANHLLSDDSSTVKARYGNNLTDILRSVNTYAYGTGASYALGSVLSITSVNYKNGVDGGSSGAPDTLTTNSYAWYGGAVQSSSSHDSDLGSGSNPLWTSTYTLGALGQLVSVAVNDGIPKTVTFTNDEAGQIIRRDESRNSLPGGPAPHEVWYRSGARTLGQTGNNGSDDVSYSVSVSERSKARPDVTNSNAGLFRGGVNSGAAYADFAQSLESINSFGQGSASGTYTVRSGDTLGGIALALYGDANLWYKIAEANGLSAAAALTEGMGLRLPAGVQRSSFNASTLTPYDPSEAVGDLSPTTPKPPKNNKCAVVGQLLLAVVAIAVVAIVAPYLTGTVAQAAVAATGTSAAVAATAATGLTAALGATGGAIVGGGLAAAAGSIASQGFGLATGLQSSFSWKSVGLAALSGGIGGGISGINAFGGGNWLAAVGRGAASSAISQGIGVATGLQSKFSWAGVAAAGAGAGIGYLGGRELGISAIGGAGGDRSIGNYAAHLATNGASLLANAATRSLVEGSNFGDNVMAALPDVLAQTIGDAIAYGVTGSASEAAVGGGDLGQYDGAERGKFGIPEGTNAIERALGFDVLRSWEDGGAHWGPIWPWSRVDVGVVGAEAGRIGAAILNGTYDPDIIVTARSIINSAVDNVVSGSNYLVEQAVSFQRTIEARVSAAGNTAAYYTPIPMYFRAASNAANSHGWTGLGRDLRTVANYAEGTVGSVFGLGTGLINAGIRMANPTGGLTTAADIRDMTSLAISAGSNALSWAANHPVEAVLIAVNPASAVVPAGSAYIDSANRQYDETRRTLGRDAAQVGYSRTIADPVVAVGSIALSRGAGLGRLFGARGIAAEGVGGRFATEAQVVAGIERNADIAVELTRRQVSRGILTNTDPAAFGSRAHLLFNKLNTRLGRELRLDGSDFRLRSEVFRDSTLLDVIPNARGSIGADVFLTHRVDPFYSRVFDLKTHGLRQIPISSGRQTLFQTRFGAQAEELYRPR